MSFAGDLWKASAIEAMRDVFDRLVFRDYEEVAAGWTESDASKASVVRMQLRVDPVVTLVFAIGDELARDLSAAILGMDDSEVQPEDLQDTASELLNMIGGEMKTALFEKGIEFDLGIPDMLGVWPFAAGDGESSQDVVDGQVRISGRLGEEPVELRILVA